MKEKVIIISSVLFFVLATFVSPLQFYCKGEVDKNKAGKDSIKKSVALAELYVKKGFQNEEQLHFGLVTGKENFALARKYFAQAETLLNENRAKLLLKWGWFKYDTSKEKSEAAKMLEGALALSPNNPKAYYKNGYVKLKSYYRSFESKNPKVIKVLPSGEEFLEETVYYYSTDRDNSDLEAAQRYFEKAIKLDKTLSNAYSELARIHIFKKEDSEAASDYSKLLKYKDHINMELLFFDEEGKERMIKAAKTFLKYHPLKEEK